MARARKLLSGLQNINGCSLLLKTMIENKNEKDGRIQLEIAVGTNAEALYVP
jgi:hypothetical protein